MTARKSKRRRFFVTMTAHIEISQELLDSVLTDEWRSTFYDHLREPEDIAEMLAFNLAQGREIKSLDGFADQPERAAKLLDFRSEGPGEETDE